MKKTLISALAMFLALAFGAVNLTAFAEQAQPQEQKQEQKQEKKAAKKKGKKKTAKKEEKKADKQEAARPEAGK